MSGYRIVVDRHLYDEEYDSTYSATNAAQELFEAGTIFSVVYVDPPRLFQIEAVKTAKNYTPPAEDIQEYIEPPPSDEEPLPF